MAVNIHQSRFGNKSLSTVVRTQNNLCKTIPSKNETPKTFQNGIANTAEIINAPIIVIITSIIARFANLYEWIPSFGLPRIFLYGQSFRGWFLQGQPLLCLFLHGQSLHGPFLHGQPLYIIMYYDNIFISNYSYFSTYNSIHNMQSKPYNTILTLHTVNQ